MVGNSMVLGFPNPKNNCVSSLREQAARITLRNVRSKGHLYIELREDNKKLIFLCVLCLSPCHNDSVLHDHLRGNFHKKMYEAAKSTLLKENPWPFNDGMNVSADNNRLAIVERNEYVNESVDFDENEEENGYHLIIPDVLLKDGVVDLDVTCIGLGKIGVRYYQKDGLPNGIGKIWCEWLGDINQNQEDINIIPQHDFAIVLFAFNYDMGRKGLLDNMLLLMEANKDKKGKKRKSFSDPEDVSNSLSNEYESFEDEYPVSCSSNSKNVVAKYGDNSLQLKLIPNRNVRKELRIHKRLASERVCDICQHKILPGKDVATLVNMKTGRLVCSSRNLNGAFHAFHISCLIHWVLFCEYEIYTKQLVGSEVKKRLRRKKGAKKAIEAEKEVKKQIYSPFCPECQGTGIDIDGNELEKPTISLSEMFKYKMKSSDGQREYMKNPEMLQNCSTGFYFPPKNEETLQENVSPLKMIRFYRAAE